MLAAKHLSSCRRTLAFVLGIMLCVLAVKAAPGSSSDSVFAELSALVSQCARHRNAISPNKDRSVLCFDGEIRPDRDFSAINNLKQDGFFVVRSGGGFSPLAVKLASILRDKNATVVIYDYCLSACANYFLVASSKTYVLKDALVAWHGGPGSISCHPEVIEQLEKQLREHYGDLQRLGPAFSPQLACDARKLSSAFFKERGINDRHIYAPQTAYTKMQYDFSVKQGANRRSLFWMWNPQNYGEYFKSSIVYESYPRSQAEVDEIISRLELRMRAFFDPARF